MNKRIVPLFSLLMMLAMLCIPIANAGTLTTEEQAAEKGAEVFQAWYVINRSNYQYMTTDYVSPYRFIVDDRKDSIVWNGLLTAWRVATFDITSEVTNFNKELAYYDTILFNILYDSDSDSLGTSFISAYADKVGDAEKEWRQISASTWNKLSKVNEAFKTSDAIHADDSEWVKSFNAQLQEIGDIQEAMKVIGDVTKYLGYCKTAVDTVEKISKIEVLLKNTDETASVLLDMRNSCEKNLPNSLLLLSALDEYYSIISHSLTSEQIAALFAGTATMTETTKTIARLTWNLITKAAGEYGLMITAAQAVGKFGADNLFNSSSSIAAYYKLQAIYAFEDLIKAETLSCQRAFENNPTPATAKKFIAAYKLLYKTYLEGLDYTSSFIKASYLDGHLNQIVRFINDGGYQDMLKSISNIGSSLKSALDYYDTGSYNHYLDVLNSIEDTNVLYVELLPNVNVDPQQEESTIRIADQKMSNAVYSSDVTLSEDITL